MRTQRLLLVNRIEALAKNASRSFHPLASLSSCTILPVHLQSGEVAARGPSAAQVLVGSLDLGLQRLRNEFCFFMITQSQALWDSTNSTSPAACQEMYKVHREVGIGSSQPGQTAVLFHLRGRITWCPSLLSLPHDSQPGPAVSRGSGVSSVGAQSSCSPRLTATVCTRHC